MKTIVALAAVITAAVYAAAPLPSQPAAQRLTIEQLIDIKHPSNPMWSPDGRHVAFLWDRAGVSDWYIADADGKGSPRVALRNDGAAGPVTWSADSQSLVRRADGTPSPDGTYVALIRGNDLIVRSVGDGSETRVASDARLGGVGWSPDGAYLLFTTGASSIRHEQTPSYSGSKIVYTINENVPGQAYGVVIAPAARADRESSSSAARASGGVAPRAVEHV